MLYGLDRFEGDYAVLIDGEGAVLNVLRTLLPQSATEGDVICYDGESYSLNESETSDRRKEVQNLIDELFK